MISSMIPDFHLERITFGLLLLLLLLLSNNRLDTATAKLWQFIVVISWLIGLYDSDLPLRVRVTTAVVNLLINKLAQV